MELWFTERHTPYVNFSNKVERQLYTAQSEFQRIDVFESREFGRFLTLDGYMMLTEKDEFIYHEMITHIPMAVHPNPENILVIGAGDGGVVRELTQIAFLSGYDDFAETYRDLLVTNKLKTEWYDEVTSAATYTYDADAAKHANLGLTIASIYGSSSSSN